MKRIERQCMKCGRRRYMGEYDICNIAVIFIPQETEECTICGNDRIFRIVVSELKEVTHDKEQS